MNIIIKPILTEKMTLRGEKLGEYGFVVQPKANKLQIKSAIEQHFGVTVNTVNTMNYNGKNKSRFTKAGYISGRTNKFKKAIVTLRDGDSIDFYSNI